MPDQTGIDAVGGDERLVRVGLDLHDGSLQDLAFAIGHLRELRDRVAEGEPSELLLTSIDEVESVLTAVVDDLRILSRSLAAGIAPEPAFDDALSDVVTQFSTRSGIAVDLRVTGEFETLASQARRALVQVAREALTNVLKHSAASRVGVDAVVDEAGARLEVVDDGKGGVDPTTVPSGGLGIPGMAERMRVLGGRLDVQSGPNGGTRVIAVLPRRR